MIGFSLMFAAVGVGWLGMIYGWGLTPISWPWIIGTSVVAIFLIGLAGMCARLGDK